MISVMRDVRTSRTRSTRRTNERTMDNVLKYVREAASAVCGREALKNDDQETLRLAHKEK